MLEKDEFNNLIHSAEELGKEGGKANAGWTIPGNADRSVYEKTARLMREGDPQLWDAYSNPLSGEFSDGIDEDRLFFLLEADPFKLTDEEREEICQTYEQAHSSAWYEELERIVYNFLRD